jgi:hypothetical protein
MTLVVAKKFEDGVRLLADWRMTVDGATKQPSYLSGTLKAWILRPDLCIAYAGDVAAAEKAIRQVRIQFHARPDLNKVLKTLERDHRARPQSLEFIVASRIEGHNLWVIKDGELSERAVAWIGDYHAFEKYQELEPYQHSATSKPGVSPSIQQFGSMYRAFDTLIRTAGIPSIGEVVVAVVQDETGFRYSGGAVMMPAHQDIPSGEWTKISFGTAATGGFGYVLIAAEAGTPAVGLYFPQGEIGALFYPARLEEPALFRNISQAEFCARVRQEFGFQLLPDVSVS